MEVKKWEYVGRECLILQHPSLGHYCAYVRFDALKEVYTSDMDALSVEMLLQVHGGITFNGEFSDYEGRWIGIDFAHAGDYTPRFPDHGGKKWTVEEVQTETERMAEQVNRYEELVLPVVKEFRERIETVGKALSAKNGKERCAHCGASDVYPETNGEFECFSCAQRFTPAKRGKTDGHE